MSSPQSNLIWVIILLLLLSPISLSSNLTLSGAASFLNSSISLTATSSSPNCSLPSLGSAFYPRPIRLSSSSFSSLFSFRILSSSPSCPFGDGLVFVITAKPIDQSVLVNGYMGLQEPDPHRPFFALEFDTSFDPNLGDFSSAHVGLDLNSPVSVSAVDFPDLRSEKQLTAWIEYRDPEKIVQVWVGFSKQERPKQPLIVYRVDLSRGFGDFVHVGFSASNTRGSALYLIDTWRFKTFGPTSSAVMPMDTAEDSDDCEMCYPRDESKGQKGFFGHMDKRVSELAFGLGGLAAFIVSVCSIACLVILCTMRKRKLNNTRINEGQICKGPKRLSLSEIRSATKGFNRKKIIGEGGTATVYEGVIPSFGTVAIKRFARVNQTSPFRTQFSTEFTTMVGFVKHKNLVQLQGWCCEGNELVLVYEYLPNGSLDQVLHNYNSAISGFLMWERRLSILLGVGSALIYLHEQCERQIIHRDVKTCNIMLDGEFNPKLGDFGLAEVYDHSSILREATLPAGTVGYLAPEYVYTGIPTVKTDVYSYGVVILEVVTGQRPVGDSGVMLADRMWDLWEKGQLIEAVDLNMRGKFKRCEVERVLMVGLSCVHPSCGERPTVKAAVGMIRGEVAMRSLPLRKPRVRISSDLPEGSMEILSLASGEQTFHDSPWLTPKSHF